MVFCSGLFKCAPASVLGRQQAGTAGRRHGREQARALSEQPGMVKFDKFERVEKAMKHFVLAIGWIGAVSAVGSISRQDCVVF